LINIRDLSVQQRNAILLLSTTEGFTTGQIAEKLGTGRGTASMLDSLRNRGVVKALGHYSPVRCKWLLTDAGVEVQKQLKDALPN